MKKISELVACILLAGSAIAFAAGPQVKVAVADVDRNTVPAKVAAKPVKVGASEAAVYDYRLERESCCGPQN